MTNSKDDAATVPETDIATMPWTPPTLVVVPISESQLNSSGTGPDGTTGS